MPDNAPQMTRSIKFISLWSSATIIVVAVILIGGKIEPTPWTHITVSGTECVDSSVNGWYFPSGKHRCTSTEASKGTIYRDSIYYAFQVPQVEGDEASRYSRWQWRLYGVLRLRLVLNNDNAVMKPDPPHKIILKSRLGYMNKNDHYKPTLIAANYQERKLYCVFIKKHSFDELTYDCSPQVVVVLYSVHHDHYLINILLPLFRDDTNEWVNRNFEAVKGLYITFFSLSSWYTKMLVSLQTVFFPVLATILWRFWKSFSVFERRPDHLERDLALLAVALTVMNCPLEFVTLIGDCPWLIVINDIRQTFFYASFMTFFLYLTDRHVEPGRLCPHSRKGIDLYIRSGTLAILIVDMIEHIIMLDRPLAMTYESMHMSMSLVGFSLLGCYLTCITIRTCSALVAINQKGPVHEGDTGCQEAVILIITWVCFSLTAADFIIKRLHEGMWMWEYTMGQLEIMNTCGFLLGIYCMWNVYTCVLLVIFTPFSKTPQPRGRFDMSRVVGVPLGTQQYPSFVDMRVTTL
ncbi:protein wntless-like isoform X1 [Panulirus ornatus]|uniref:protein wntless-like isoform X1 n=1 Tax=Panulirus ornatus TaxID=150431 RepID=UPI003A8A2D28